MSVESNCLGAFRDHGVEFSSTTGGQAKGTCPFCQKTNHFYVNTKTGPWDCKACGESGNIISFLGKIVEYRRQQTTGADYKRLARKRGIPVGALKRWGLCWDGSQWLIPARASSGEVHDLRRWKPATGDIRSTTGCKVQLFGADRLAKASPTFPVWVCEGEWDAMALSEALRQAKLRGVVVAVPGAGVFKPEWVGLFRGRRVRLCYDADEAGSKGMTKAVARLHGVASEVQVLRWPEGTARGWDLRDQINADRENGAEPKAVIQGLRALLGPAPETPTGSSQPAIGARGEVDPHDLASQLVSAQFSTGGGCLALRYFSGAWWTWEEGRYRLIETVELQAVVNRALRLALDAAGSRKQVGQTLVAYVLRAMDGMCLVPGGVSLPAWLGETPQEKGENLLAMSNGLLDLDAVLAGENQCLSAPTPEWFSLTSWPFAFDAKARCPAWRRFLTEVLPNPADRCLLQEYLGYCLTFDTSQHKCLVLVGEGANGKSVVTEVATHCLGEDNVTHIGLERFGDRFAMAPMVGKLANIVSELGRAREIAEDMLKSVVSGDRVTVEHKYRPPMTVVLTARQLFATNELPTFKDRSQGLWRRLMVLSFNVTIPENKLDRALARIICRTEAPGVFNWMVEGLKRLRAREAFKPSRASCQAVEGHRTASNPALTFLKERCVTDPTGLVECGRLYLQYSNWCECQKLRPLKKQQFGQEVRRAFPGVERRQTRAGEKRSYQYVGLKTRGRGSAVGGRHDSNDSDDSNARSLLPPLHPLSFPISLSRTERETVGVVEGWQVQGGGASSTPERTPAVMGRVACSVSKADRRFPNPCVGARNHGPTLTPRQSAQRVGLPGLGNDADSAAVRKFVSASQSDASRRTTRLPRARVQGKRGRARETG